MSKWGDYKKDGKLRVDEKIKKLGLLIVDDEEKIVSSLGETFSPLFEVHSSSNSMEGLEIFKEVRPKLILSDQRMPELTGIELFKRIHEIDPTTVNILITGYSDINIVIEALNEGICWKYVTKPWDPEELKQLVLKGAGEYIKTNEPEGNRYGAGFIGF
jgi:DNA-binding NtrC family response regulator